jgi:hypothetical protein
MISNELMLKNLSKNAESDLLIDSALSNSMKQVKIAELEKGSPLSRHIYHSAGGINKANAKLSYPEQAHKLWCDVNGKERRS